MSRFFVLVGIVLVAAALFVFLSVGGSSTTSGLKVLHLAIDTDPKTLDPIAVTDTISDGLAHKVHSSLVRFNNKLIVEGELAEKFEVSPDGKLYTFTLRKGVHFHNGREMKAADVVYSFERLLSPESKRPEWLKPMVVGSEERFKDQKSPLGIKAKGDYVVTIELNAPFAPFIQHLCSSNCAIVPKEAVEDKSKPFSRNPVGVGPFKMVEWLTSEVVRFVRNDDYFKGRPKLDEIQFHIVKDPNTRLEQYFAGQLDAVGDLPAGRVIESVKRAGDEAFTYSALRTNYIGISAPNGKFTEKAELKPFGTNKLLRQAINYAIDRDHLCNVTLEGRGEPAKGVLPPGMPGYKEGRPGWPKDIEKAKALLKEAGYPNGENLPVLTLLHRNDENTKKIAQVIQADLEKVGIKTELSARDWNTFLEMVESEPRQMFMLGWVADYPDPDNFLYVLFNSNQWGAAGNHTWFSNPEIDKLTNQARELTKMEDRIPLYNKAEDLILEESPWICTYHVKNVVLIRRNIKGIRENTTGLDTGTEFPQVDFAFVDKE